MTTSTSIADLTLKISVAVPGDLVQRCCWDHLGAHKNCRPVNAALIEHAVLDILIKDGDRLKTVYFDDKKKSTNSIPEAHAFVVYVAMLDERNRRKQNVSAFIIMSGGVTADHHSSAIFSVKALVETLHPKGKHLPIAVWAHMDPLLLRALKENSQRNKLTVSLGCSGYDNLLQRLDVMQRQAISMNSPTATPRMQIDPAYFNGKRWSLKHITKDTDDAERPLLTPTSEEERRLAIATHETAEFTDEFVVEDIVATGASDARMHTKRLALVKTTNGLQTLAVHDSSATTVATTGTRIEHHAVDAARAVLYDDEKKAPQDMRSHFLVLDPERAYKAWYTPERFSPRRVLDVSNHSDRAQFINIQQMDAKIDTRIASPFFEVHPNVLIDSVESEMREWCGFYSYEVGDVVKVYIHNDPSISRRYEFDQIPRAQQALLRPCKESTSYLQTVYPKGEGRSSSAVHLQTARSLRNTNLVSLMERFASLRLRSNNPKSPPVLPLCSSLSAYVFARHDTHLLDALDRCLHSVASDDQVACFSPEHCFHKCILLTMKNGETLLVPMQLFLPLKSAFGCYVLLEKHQTRAIRLSTPLEEDDYRAVSGVHWKKRESKRRPTVTHELLSDAHAMNEAFDSNADDVKLDHRQWKQLGGLSIGHNHIIKHFPRDPRNQPPDRDEGAVYYVQSVEPVVLAFIRNLYKFVKDKRAFSATVNKESVARLTCVAVRESTIRTRFFAQMAEMCTKSYHFEDVTRRWFDANAGWPVCKGHFVYTLCGGEQGVACPRAREFSYAPTKADPAVEISDLKNDLLYLDADAMKKAPFWTLNTRFGAHYTPIAAVSDALWFTVFDIPLFSQQSAFLTTLPCRSYMEAGVCVTPLVDELQMPDREKAPELLDVLLPTLVWVNHLILQISGDAPFADATLRTVWQDVEGLKVNSESLSNTLEKMSAMFVSETSVANDDSMLSLEVTHNHELVGYAVLIDMDTASRFSPLSIRPPLMCAYEVVAFHAVGDVVLDGGCSVDRELVKRGVRGLHTDSVDEALRGVIAQLSDYSGRPCMYRSLKAPENEDALLYTTVDLSDMWINDQPCVLQPLVFPSESPEIRAPRQAASQLGGPLALNPMTKYQIAHIKLYGTHCSLSMSDSTILSLQRAPSESHPSMDRKAINSLLDGRVINCDPPLVHTAVDRDLPSPPMSVVEAPLFATHPRLRQTVCELLARHTRSSTMVVALPAAVALTGSPLTVRDVGSFGLPPRDAVVLTTLENRHLFPKDRAVPLAVHCNTVDDLFFLADTPLDRRVVVFDETNVWGACMMQESECTGFVRSDPIRDDWRSFVAFGSSNLGPTTSVCLNAAHDDDSIVVKADTSIAATGADSAESSHAHRATAYFDSDLQVRQRFAPLQRTFRLPEAGGRTSVVSKQKSAVERALDIAVGVAGEDGSASRISAGVSFLMPEVAQFDLTLTPPADTTFVINCIVPLDSHKPVDRLRHDIQLALRTSRLQNGTPDETIVIHVEEGAMRPGMVSLIDPSLQQRMATSLSGGETALIMVEDLARGREMLVTQFPNSPIASLQAPNEYLVPSPVDSETSHFLVTVTIGVIEAEVADKWRMLDESSSGYVTKKEHLQALDGVRAGEQHDSVVRTHNGRYMLRVDAHSTSEVVIEESRLVTHIHSAIQTCVGTASTVCWEKVLHAHAAVTVRLRNTLSVERSLADALAFGPSDVGRTVSVLGGRIMVEGAERQAKWTDGTPSDIHEGVVQRVHSDTLGFVDIATRDTRVTIANPNRATTACQNTLSCLYRSLVRVTAPWAHMP